MTPSVQQQAVLNWTVSGHGSLNLEAKAGAGKTSTIVLMLGLLKGRVLVCAFSKKIVEAMVAKVGVIPGVTISTVHALGLKLLRDIYSAFGTAVDIDATKVKGLAKQAAPFDRKLADLIEALVGYGKQSGFDLNGFPSSLSDESWDALMNHYDLWEEVPAGISMDRVYEDCKRIYARSLYLARHEGRVDFNDMVLLPLFYIQKKGPDALRMYNWVLVDEAQDTNTVRRLLVMSVLQKGGRLVAVGDSRQAIMGFSGADNKSMDAIKDAMGSQVLPLSVCYRCGVEIVKRAQTWVPDIEAAPGAHEGKVTMIDGVDPENMATFWTGLGQGWSPEDVIICRNTFPLVGMAQRLRGMGVDCIVESDSASKAILALACRWGVEGIKVGYVLDQLQPYLEEQVAKWTAKGRPERVEMVAERVNSVRDICNNLGAEESVRNLIRNIESLFGMTKGSDERRVLRLCTIHKSKGREWRRVFWVGANAYQPSKWATQDWEYEQEENLMYVACTRAMEELVEVQVPVKRSAEDPEFWET